MDGQKYYGTLVKHAPLDDGFPESPWRSLTLRWDNTDEEFPDETFSPWDLDPAVPTAQDGIDQAATASSQPVDQSQIVTVPETQDEGDPLGGEAESTGPITDPVTDEGIALPAEDAVEEPSMDTAADGSSQLPAETSNTSMDDITPMIENPSAATENAIVVENTATGGSVDMEEVASSDVWHEPEEIERLLNGLKTIMELPIAREFASPVDYAAYPEYCKLVGYPSD